METKNTDQKAGQYTVFLLDKQLCALPIEEVVEIIKVQPITDVPGVDEYISGMINLRGKIIPVINLRNRFSFTSLHFHKKTRIIVVHDDGEDIGIIVDEVMMVTHVKENDLEPPMEMFNTLEKDCFRGFAKIENNLIGILNLQKVLYPDRNEEV